MLNVEELKTGLQHCKATTRYFKHPFGLLQYTDGIQYLAKNAEAYWLVYAIASYQSQLIKKPELREFPLWFLHVENDYEFIKPASNHCAVLTGWEDTPEVESKLIIRQDILFTDFPLPEIKLYVNELILILPSEG